MFFLSKANFLNFILFHRKIKSTNFLFGIRFKLLPWERFRRHCLIFFRWGAIGVRSEFLNFPPIVEEEKKTWRQFSNFVCCYLRPPPPIPANGKYHPANLVSESNLKLIFKISTDNRSLCFHLLLPNFQTPTYFPGHLDMNLPMAFHPFKLLPS